MYINIHTNIMQTYTHTKEQKYNYISNHNIQKMCPKNPSKLNLISSIPKKILHFV